MIIDETDEKYKIMGKAQCEACGGTGIYQGMAERDGSAVICYRCQGTGAIEVNVTYKKFKGRRERKGVKRVFSSSSGYVISAKDAKDVPFSKYGASYKDWLEGKTPIPIKTLHCPLQHHGQTIQAKGHPLREFYQSHCKKHLGLGSMICECSNRCNMNECWKTVEAVDTN